MTKKELEKAVEEQRKIIDRQKQRAKKQNERAKERWETVSCRLPLGTKSRIAALGLTVNGLINHLLLSYLDAPETVSGQPPADQTHVPDHADGAPGEQERPEALERPDPASLEDLQAILDSRRAEISVKKAADRERAANVAATKK